MGDRMAFRQLRNPALRTVAFLFILFFFFGCGGTSRAVKKQAWYQSGILLPVSANKLAGKRIVLDPGHGGKFSGAVGSAGLKEKDINLTVTYHLKKLLEREGAIVFLTRDTDRDFLTERTEHVREDLRNRMALVDSLHPDFFLSIHHNSSALKPPENNTKTFYKIDDAGASLDAAASIHRSFVRFLKIEEQHLQGA